MQKRKCQNCATLNFEKVRICSSCRGPVSVTDKAFAQKSWAPGGYAKLILIGLVLIAVGTASVLGYRKYSAHSREKAETEEVQKFTTLAFRNDPVSVTTNLATKLPSRFRVPPPDLEVLNRFPFREKLISKIAPKYMGEDVTSSPGSFNPGVVIGSTGPATHTTGGWSPGSTSSKPIYSSQTERRVIRAERIDGYRYQKNAAGQLVVEVRFIAVTQGVTKEKGPFTTACGYGVDECVYGSTTERFARMKLVREPDGWKIVFVGLEPGIGSNEQMPEIESWVEGTEPRASPLADLVPTRMLPHYPLQDGGTFVDQHNEREFYRAEPKPLN